MITLAKTLALRLMWAAAVGVVVATALRFGRVDQAVAGAGGAAVFLILGVGEIAAELCMRARTRRHG